MQDFCKINGYWQYMLEQIPKPALFSKNATPIIQKIFDTKLIKWLIITNLFCRAIQTTYIINPMLHIRDMKLPSHM